MEESEEARRLDLLTNLSATLQSTVPPLCAHECARALSGSFQMRVHIVQ